MTQETTDEIPVMFPEDVPTVDAQLVESGTGSSSYDNLSGYALFLDKLKDPSAEQLVTRVKLFVSKLPLTFSREMAAEKLHKYVLIPFTQVST